MKINGKEYKINADIEFGLMEDMTKKGDDPEVMKKAFKKILVPAPTVAEMRKFKQSDIFRFMKEFQNAQKKMNTEFKKKLS